MRQRRPLLLSLLAATSLATAACGDRVSDPIAPPIPPETLEQVLATADPAAGEILRVAAPTLALIGRLPRELQLTADQQAQIRALADAHGKALADDIAALKGVMDKIAAAVRAGSTREDVASLTAQLEPIARRIAAASDAFGAQVVALLTPAQRAWVEQQMRCLAQRVTLTEAQRTAIAALTRDFETANRADLALVATVMQEARAAQLAGKSRAEIQVILAKATPALERLAKARAELESRIRSIVGGVSCWGTTATAANG